MTEHEPNKKFRYSIRDLLCVVTLIAIYTGGRQLMISHGLEWQFVLTGCESLLLVSYRIVRRTNSIGFLSSALVGGAVASIVATGLVIEVLLHFVKDYPEYFGGEAVVVAMLVIALHGVFGSIIGTVVVAIAGIGGGRAKGEEVGISPIDG